MFEWLSSLRGSPPLWSFFFPPFSQTSTTSHPKRLSVISATLTNVHTVQTVSNDICKFFLYIYIYFINVCCSSLFLLLFFFPLSGCSMKPSVTVINAREKQRRPHSIEHCKVSNRHAIFSSSILERLTLMAGDCLFLEHVHPFNTLEVPDLGVNPFKDLRRVIRASSWRWGGWGEALKCVQPHAHPPTSPHPPRLDFWCPNSIGPTVICHSHNPSFISEGPWMPCLMSGRNPSGACLVYSAEN